MPRPRSPRLTERLDAVEGVLSDALAHASRRKRRLPGLHGLVDQLERTEEPWTPELRQRWMEACERVLDYSMARGVKPPERTTAHEVLP